MKEIESEREREWEKERDREMYIYIYRERESIHTIVPVSGPKYSNWLKCGPEDCAGVKYY